MNDYDVVLDEEKVMTYLIPALNLELRNNIYSMEKYTGHSHKNGGLRQRP